MSGARSMEAADGVLPVWGCPENMGPILDPLGQGLEKAGRSRADIDIAPYVKIKMGDDLQACRDALKPEFSLYIGGMGAREKNFYNDFAKRLGFEEAAVKIQQLFLTGQRFSWFYKIWSG